MRATLSVRIPPPRDRSSPICRLKPGEGVTTTMHSQTAERTEHAETSQTKIRIDGVNKHFEWTSSGVHHHVHALQDIDLEIREGEFLAVIGPSGCGKTTLLRIIGGLETHESGVVQIDDARVTGPGPDRSIVFQTFGLFPWKTVYDNVAFPLKMRNLPKDEIRERCEHYLEMVGLSRFPQSYPHQLSGGMQQRVGLARALATDPEILLMDEPFGAIDAQTRELMQEELMRIWAGSRNTVMFITHDLDEAVYLADRIVVLTRGPGRVRQIIDVNLPRPRWEYDVRSHERFAEVRRAIWDMLRGDLIEEEREAGMNVNSGT
ncbi:MAG: ABC transporter ATP-binding protein [Thermomicrobiales bacterium]